MVYAVLVSDNSQPTTFISLPHGHISIAIDKIHCLWSVLMKSHLRPKLDTRRFLLCSLQVRSPVGWIPVWRLGWVARVITLLARPGGRNSVAVRQRRCGLGGLKLGGQEIKIMHARCTPPLPSKRESQECGLECLWLIFWESQLLTERSSIHRRLALPISNVSLRWLTNGSLWIVGTGFKGEYFLKCRFLLIADLRQHDLVLCMYWSQGLSIEFCWFTL